ncbi:MAG: release factor glutamine methyltransferase [Gemmatimonadota bacterium]|nr:MAG: release factor glutamine methyltransferase [Gemmatimonadota bacterium]
MTHQTLKELVDAGAQRLVEAAGDARENPRHEARLLMQAAVGLDRGRMIVQSDEPIGQAEMARFWDMVGDRSRGVPLQLIVGETAFHNVTLQVEDGVFIPRPETELLVEEVVNAARQRGREQPRDGRPGGVQILDLCTGTGAVAVAAAAALRDERRVAVSAGDWNPRAVRVARRNARRNHVDVDVRRSDLFSAFAQLEGSVDVLASNPPYIAPSEAESLSLEVRLGDPKEALFDPEGGTGFHRRIARRGRAFLRAGGTLILEMGETQGAEVMALVEEAGYTEVRTLPDLAGRDRFVRAVWPGGENQWMRSS